MSVHRRRSLRLFLSLTWAELVAVTIGVVLAGAVVQQSGPLAGLVAFSFVAVIAWRLAQAHRFDAVRRAEVWRRREAEARIREQLAAGQWS
jgi:hypothetical protein